MSGLARPAALHSVFERSFHEQRHALTGWAVGLVGFAVVMLAMYPTVRGNEQFSKLVEAYPKALQELFSLADYTSGAGYLRAEVFSFVGPLLVVIFGVLWGGDVVAGEEDRGTVDLLLANPVSRRRVVLEKWGAVLLGVAVATAALGATLALGSLAVGLHVSAAALGAAVVATALLGMLFATTALAIGAATGHRGLARGLTAALAVVAYLLSTLPELVSWLRPARPLSPWYHALGVDPLASGFQPLHLLVVVALTVAVTLIGLVAYDRRDLGV